MRVEGSGLGINAEAKQGQTVGWGLVRHSMSLLLIRPVWIASAREYWPYMFEGDLVMRSGGIRAREHQVSHGRESELV